MRGAKVWDPRQALQRAGTQLAMPIVWACATDAAGFASLLVAGVGPIQDFGLMMALGAVLVIVSVALLVPGLALAGRVDADPQRAWGEDRLDASLRRLLDWVERRPKTVGVVTLLVGGGLTAGVFRIDVETDFTKNFRRWQSDRAGPTSRSKIAWAGPLSGTLSCPLPTGSIGPTWPESASSRPCCGAMQPV